MPPPKPDKPIKSKNWYCAFILF